MGGLFCGAFHTPWRHGAAQHGSAAWTEPANHVHVPSGLWCTWYASGRAEVLAALVNLLIRHYRVDVPAHKKKKKILPMALTPYSG